MPSYINTNILSLDAQRNLSTSQSALATSIQRLSSGLRINTAADDAAGLAIAARFTSQINGSNQAARNANDGVSLAQTAEGDLTQIANNLQRIRELAVQSANGTNSSTDRAALNSESQQLIAEIDRVATSASFNGVNLLDGSFTNQQFQVGANAGQTINVAAIASARASALGQSYGVNLAGTTLTASTGITAAGQFLINGTDVFTASGGNAVAGSASAIASAINASAITGVTATANATNVTGTYGATAGITAGTATLTVNGIAIGLNLTGVGATDVANTIAAVNANSAATGVVAVSSGTGVKLTAADGRNISTAFALGTATNAANQDIGLGTVGATVWSNYTLNYSGNAGVTVTGTVNAGGTTGLGNAVTNSAATGTAVSAIDLTTVNGANLAIASIDSALASVNSSSASLGAYQNRFSSVVASLQTTSENLSAARSRIQDTDYAAETANLTRGQILQQAGTAILAQANQIPNTVLTLLK